MSFLRAALAARAGQSRPCRILTALIVVLLVAGLSLSCGSSGQRSSPNHVAYVTLPVLGSVLLLRIDNSTGTIAVGGSTPQVEGTSPTGLALTPSKKFLYVANTRANTISIFNVAEDGTLALVGVPKPAGSGPNAAAVDPSGQYLLVTNNFSNDISVYSIDAGSGVLSEVAGSPFPANANPSEIVFTHSGRFVYVVNPGIGMITGFSFDISSGTLAPAKGSPVFSGDGATALTVDASDQFLYVANHSASNPPPFTGTQGNISGFRIDPNSGALGQLAGSPFIPTNGTGPSAIAIDPTGRFVYATTTGSSYSIWCFAITPTNGELASVTGSPFSLASGGLFALFDPSGNFFYIGSDSSHGVEAYTYDQSTGAPKVIAGSPFSTGTSPGDMVLSH